MNEADIATTVNGVKVERTVAVRTSLVDFLRYDLCLTGTHVGCEHGACGACTVQVEGAAVRACLMLAVQINGKQVATVESLGKPDALSPLQRAFSKHHALQCGFCTPGFLMTIDAWLGQLPAGYLPNDEEIRDMLSGNVCRCTGYQNIVEAVRELTRARANGAAA
ncbi:carbon-monoxide dehydrogenase small subunit [Paraburkholderia youngii]|uniref:(2Fe-2S)-binding protein n=1 Tax=Paraburkholderia youngii TaxID=2782701 RepID=UPI003D1D3662